MRFETDVFFDELLGRHALTKNRTKTSDLGRQLDFACYIWEESAGEAVCQGGERGGVIENC